jgi:hypothetical protein
LNKDIEKLTKKESNRNPGNKEFFSKKTQWKPTLAD